MKNKKPELILLIIITILVVSSLLTLLSVIEHFVIKTARFIADPVPVYASTEVLVSSPKEEIPMKEWVLNEVALAGLDVKKVDAIIQCESGWNNWNNNWNTNGTIDSGLWMINSVHKKTISLEDRYNYKTATKWAINKRLHDGNWSAWACN